ncbi:MAG: hypothetical protein PHX70_07880 [Clostridium sp.]|nr:hypothetical protein [Clostridium sp.]
MEKFKFKIFRKVNNERHKLSYLKYIRYILILTILATFLPILNKAQAVTQTEVVSNGKVADLSFDNGNVTNLINNKTYSLGEYGGSGTGNYVSTPYGSGIQFTGGQIRIPTADLNITENTKITTIAYDIDCNNDIPIEPFSFDLYESELSPIGRGGSSFGFNTYSNDIYGTNSNPLVPNTYVHVIMQFVKNSPETSLLYINGVKQILTRKMNAPSLTNAIFGSTFYISGYKGDGGSYRLNGSTISNVEMWNRGLTDSEASTVYAESLVKKAQQSKSTTDISAAAQAVRLLPASTDKTTLQTEISALIHPTVTTSLQTDHNHLTFNINDTSQNYTYKLYKKNVTAGETSFTGEGDFPYSGMTGEFNFDDGTAYNVINNKDYNVDAYGLTGGTASEVSTPYGPGLKFNKGQIQIPTSDLSISDASTNDVTVSFMINYSGEYGSAATDMGDGAGPIFAGFNQYDTWINSGGNTNMGFNTSTGDMYGTANPISANTYSMVTLEFHNGDYTGGKIYVNGIKKGLLQLSGKQTTSKSVWGSTLCISGWTSTDNYRLNGSTITGLKVWNRALSNTEVENVYNYSNGLSTPSATLLTNKTFSSDSRDYINLGRTNFDFSKGFKVSYNANFKSNGTTVLDLGNGAPSDNILIYNPSDATTSMSTIVYKSNTAYAVNELSANSNNNWTIKLDSSGNYTLYKNGVSVYQKLLSIPDTIMRSNCYIGASNWKNYFFQGDISNEVLSTYATSYDDYFIQDTTKPTSPTVTYSHAGHDAQFTLSSTPGTGNTYEYYVVATGDDGQKYTSDTVTFNGLKSSSTSYNYTIDKTASGTIPNTSSDSNLNIVEPSGSYYIHANAISSSGAVSNTTDYAFQVYGNILTNNQTNFNTSWLDNSNCGYFGDDNTSESIQSGGWNSGNYMKLTANGSHEAWVANKSLNLKPNTEYKVTAMYKLPNNKTTSNRLFGCVNKTNTLDIKNLTSTQNFSSWKYFSGTFTTDSTPTDIFRVYIPQEVTEVDVSDLEIIEQEPLPSIKASFNATSNNGSVQWQADDSSQNYNYSVNRQIINPYGLVGNFSIEQDGSLTNMQNSKNYALLNNPNDTSGGNVVTTPYGRGIRFSGGQVKIPTSDLNILDSNTHTVTIAFNYWFSGSLAYNSIYSQMPLGFTTYDLLHCNGNLGFNSGDADLFGVPYSSSSWHRVVVEFAEGDYTNSELFIDGVKKPISKKLNNTQSTLKSVFGDYLYIGGWGYDNYHNPNGSIISNIQVWNRALTDSEAVQSSTNMSQIYSGTSTSLSDNEATDTLPPEAVSSVTQSNGGTTTGNQSIGLSWTDSHDYGYIYNYYVDSKGSLDNWDYQSGISPFMSSTGLKGYYWSVDSSQTGTPDGSKFSATPSIAFNPQSLGLTPGTYYFHVVSVDNAGNKSSVYTQQITVPPVINMSVDNTDVNFGDIDMINPSKELDSVFNLNVDSNAKYNLSVKATSSLTGSTYTIPVSHISLRVHGTNTFLSLSSTGQVTLSSSLAATSSTTISIDIVFNNTWDVPADNYKVVVMVTAAQ